jgi:hypothetical protein
VKIQLINFTEATASDIQLLLVPFVLNSKHTGRTSYGLDGSEIPILCVSSSFLSFGPMSSNQGFWAATQNWVANPATQVYSQRKSTYSRHDFEKTTWCIVGNCTVTQNHGGSTELTLFFSTPFGPGQIRCCSSLSLFFPGKKVVSLVSLLSALFGCLCWCN